MLAEIGELDLSDTALIYDDNAGARFLATNPVTLARSKHIDVRYHFIRDLLTSKQLELRAVDSKENISDLLTKPLTTASYEKHRQSLGLVVCTKTSAGSDVAVKRGINISR